MILPTAPAATNDKFENLIAISLPYRTFVDTSATNPQEDPTDGSEKPPPQGDPAPPCSQHSNRVFRSVWYKLTGTGTPVTISTQGSRYDTLVYVFAGSPDNPVTVACNDDGFQSGIGAVESDVTFITKPNIPYYIMVSEAPPDVLTVFDQNGNPIGTAAVPLSNDATLNLSVLATPGLAAYDATLGAPLCGLVGRWCDSGPWQLLGKDNMFGGPELNQPNTIHNSCADGTTGTFHVDESIDRLMVMTATGSILRQGTIVRVSATVWVADPTQDALDLYYTTNADKPAWIYVATLRPQASGSQTLSALLRLGPGHLQAVRANFRNGGTSSFCSTGDYDDHDDLVFAVH